MRRLILLVNNGIILASCIWSTLLYWILLPFTGPVQRRIYRRLIKKNRDTTFLTRHYQEKNTPHGSLPLSDWSNYQDLIENIMRGDKGVLTREKVLLLEPTSGTTSSTKFVPYTKSLQKEFNCAIQPWIAGLYLQWPGLLLTSQYWSVSPEIKERCSLPAKTVHIGFAEDSQYLGSSQSAVFNTILAVPKEIKACVDPNTWAYITAWHLLRDPYLGLISVWHPSFLVIIVQKVFSDFLSLIKDIEEGTLSCGDDIPEYYKTLRIKPMPKRAARLRMIDTEQQGALEKIWPKLTVISCWADQPNDAGLLKIKSLFPGVYIQPKGVVATEGIFSFPFGKTHGLPAYTSHYIEFIDTGTNEIKRFNDLETGKHYETVITNGGGLYRYKMNDLVRVKKKLWGTLPQLEFLHKRDYVSDLRGEKINLQQIISLWEKIRFSYQEVLYFMVSPVVMEDDVFYGCFVVADKEDPEILRKLIADADKLLKENFHYQYARDLGQLKQPAVFLLPEDPTGEITNYLEKTGTKRGDIKLYPLSKVQNWQNMLTIEMSCRI